MVLSWEDTDVCVREGDRNVPLAFCIVKCAEVSHWAQPLKQLGHFTKVDTKSDHIVHVG